MSDREQKMADYIARARQRAQRRRSPWNLVLIPLGLAATAGVAVAQFSLVWLFHTAFYPLHELRNFWPAGISPGSFSLSLLMVFAPLPGALGAGFMLANLLLYALPPARRAFDAEARGHPGTSFQESMRGLLRLTAWALPPGLAVALVAAALLASLQ